MPADDLKIGFIGAGAMAEALLSGFIGSGLVQPQNVLVSALHESRPAYLNSKLGIRQASDNQQVVRQSDIIFLAVKPYAVRDVLISCREAFNTDKLLVSIAAGLKINQLADYLQSSEIPVVRVMPNTPALVGEAASAVSSGPAVSAQDEQRVIRLMQTAGLTITVKEELMDAVTGLSGSGPAYVYMMIEAMADAGVMAGLPRDAAYKLSAQTLLGSAKMFLETGKHPGQLKDQVTTPGGTTIAGLHELECAGMRAALQKAVLAAVSKSRELGRS